MRHTIRDMITKLMEYMLENIEIRNYIMLCKSYISCAQQNHTLHSHDTIPQFIKMKWNKTTNSEEYCHANCIHNTICKSCMKICMAMNLNLLKRVLYTERRNVHTRLAPHASIKIYKNIFLYQKYKHFWHVTLFFQSSSRPGSHQHHSPIWA